MWPGDVIYDHVTWSRSGKCFTNFRLQAHLQWASGFPTLWHHNLTGTLATPPILLKQTHTHAHTHTRTHTHTHTRIKRIRRLWTNRNPMSNKTQFLNPRCCPCRKTHNAVVVRCFYSCFSSFPGATLPRHTINKHYPLELVGDIRCQHKHCNGWDVAQHEINDFNMQLHLRIYAHNFDIVLCYGLVPVHLHLHTTLLLTVQCQSWRNHNKVKFFLHRISHIFYETYSMLNINMRKYESKLLS